MHRNFDRVKEKQTHYVKYVLMTEEGIYLVEYLIGELVFSTSITQAMVFTDHKVALQFKKLLYNRFGIVVSVNTYIS
ncbi:hypothetical protein [Capnocytophaga catalasegens]|uniref:Uncharacterized protein n=1 Tax=Capnocytophaga catalasegens TaxID=1004260 RepID=A0AAV5AR73_9FLAO|nr:hypothetical protein [Capnocytophaga catalasegens]GIZ15267.1 hypothetical protein RCZ03_12670 [Capnocytophaga catalasegens]GJM49781.1 hypothetical protein RCZ15_07560 [Capnocytophaga catalasegens]GJM52846.1 hypothetical protein RCZ16_11630 [Capnocytophaga catalasegens]